MYVYLFTPVLNKIHLKICRVTSKILLPVLNIKFVSCSVYIHVLYNNNSNNDNNNNNNKKDNKNNNNNNNEMNKWKIE